jgi:hypothetical protein
VPAPVKSLVPGTTEGTVTVTKTCTFCDEDATVENIPIKAYNKWDEGRGPHIQNVLPMLSAADREILLSGTHDECWNKAFPPDDEDMPDGDEDYDPGPEVDDQGGMSEHSHGIESEEPQNRYMPGIDYEEMRGGIWDR